LKIEVETTESPSAEQESPTAQVIVVCIDQMAHVLGMLPIFARMAHFLLVFVEFKVKARICLIMLILWLK
jgi:hypothetical protein